MSDELSADLEGTGPTDEERAAMRRELLKVAPTAADRFALMSRGPVDDAGRLDTYQQHLLKVAASREASDSRVSDPIVGKSYVVNGYGDLAMGHTAKHFIGKKCKVLSQRKDGKWELEHPVTRVSCYVAKRNLDLPPIELDPP